MSVESNRYTELLDLELHRPEWRAYDPEPRPNRSKDELRGCTCWRCKPLEGPRLALSEAALNEGELIETRDYLKDSTARKVPIENRSATQYAPHRTEWHKSDVTPTEGIDEVRWRSMWLFQTDQMGEAPVTRRAPSDDKAWRERNDKLQIADRIADRLGCTSKQRERIISMMKEVDVSVLGAHSDNRKAAIAAASIVTRKKRAYSELDRRRRDYDTSITKPVKIENSVVFEDLCNKFGFNPKFLKVARKSIERQLSERDII